MELLGGKNEKDSIFIFRDIVGVFWLPDGAKRRSKKSESGPLLYSGTIEGGQWEIRYKKEVKDGITSEVVNYILTENATGKRVGIAVNTQSTSESNSVYKFAIMAARKTEAFPSLFWDRYVINLGQSSMLLDNTIATPGEEEDYYLFVMMGGIDRYDLQSLKEATSISVELNNTTDESRKTTIPVHPNFQRALLSKMP